MSTREQTDDIDDKLLLNSPHGMVVDGPASVLRPLTSPSRLPAGADQRADDRREISGRAESVAVQAVRRCAAGHATQAVVIAGPTISAAHEVHHTPAWVWAFLERLDNHRHLDSRALRVSLIDHDGRGGRIVVATPLGLRRVARTAVTVTHEPHRLAGVVRVGRTTRAHVQWRIDSTQRGARVALESTICSTGVLDRTLLAVGGRWWLRRAFRRTLELLASALDSACEP
jgi:hypothetical protein